MTLIDRHHVETAATIATSGESYKRAVSWRERAAVVIAAVTAYLHQVEQFADRTTPLTLADWKAAFKVAYPFGERDMHPYKVWQEEASKALTERFPEVAAARNLRMVRAQERERLKRGLSPLPEHQQARLFGGTVEL